MKYCSGCKTDKPLTDFWKNKSAKDGYQAWCNVCWRAVTTARRTGPKREIELRQRQNGHLKRKYGITIEEYEVMLAKQNGKCAICGQVAGKKNLAVDHCHDTLKIRGILCENCNRGIGMFKHETKRLESAISYLAETA